MEPGVVPFSLPYPPTHASIECLCAGDNTEAAVLLKTGAFRHCWELKSLYLCGCAAYIPS